MRHRAPPLLSDEELAVYADALAERGDPLGAFLHRSLADLPVQTALERDGHRWLGELVTWFEAPGTWRRGRLVGLAAIQGPLDAVLEAVAALPTLEVLDLSALPPPPLAERRQLWNLPLQRVILSLPHTWLTPTELQPSRPAVIELRGRYGRLEVTGPPGERSAVLVERDVLGPRALERVQALLRG